MTWQTQQLPQADQTGAKHSSRITPLGAPVQHGIGTIQDSHPTSHGCRNKPVAILPSVHQQVEVAIYRVRLGYWCKWEIRGAAEVIYPECDHPTTKLLAHYLIECAITAPFFQWQQFWQTLITQSLLHCKSDKLAWSRERLSYMWGNIPPPP